MSAVAAEPRLAAAGALLAQIGDLKRVRVAGAAGSLAERGFRHACGALLAGGHPAGVARQQAAAALAGARLGGIDRSVLAAAGVPRAEAEVVLARAFEAAGGQVGEPLRVQLRSALGDAPAWASEPLGLAPWWVDALAEQPRAGATRPGHGRLVLQPAESHAEHCWVVAVGAVLLSPLYGADPTLPFLAGLLHHAHNATLPDSGFAGEVLLGEHLAPALATLRARVLDSLAPPLREDAFAALALMDEADSPEARALHAADVLDRVLELRQHARQAAFVIEQALEELDLVHPGPLQSFELGVLAEAGLR